MPPKKQKATSTDNNVELNFYKQIPENFLDEKLPNPNIHLHNFTIPFRAVVCAPSGSGKTSFVANLIKLFSAGKGTFAYITIIVRDSDEPIYKYLSSVSDAIQVKENLHNLPDLNKTDKDVASLVIVDDMQNTKLADQSRVLDYAIRCRKKNVSFMYLAQNFHIAPIVLRRNCNYIIILKLSGEREVKCILREFGLGLTKEQLLKMYNYATSEKFHCFICDCESNDINHKYRKDFTEYLQPDLFN